ncbi:UNVERIFIED_CONTAM: hypothetical protein K2H54_052538 [Gekko kuhli]
MENFLEDKEEEHILNKDKADEIILDKNLNQLLSTNRFALLGQTPTQDSILEQQSPSATPVEQLSKNELSAKASKENILFKQTSLIVETLVNLYIKIDEINLKKTSEVRQTQPSELQATTSLNDPSKDMDTEEPLECLVASSSQTTNSSTRGAPCLSSLTNLGNQYQNKNKRVNLPVFQQDDYEIDSSLLFSVYSDKHLVPTVDSKSLAEELAEVAKQSTTIQPDLNEQIKTKIPPAMSACKRTNVCVVEEQSVDEIEIDSSSSEEDILRYSTFKGSQESKRN